LLLQQPEVQAGELDTGFIERNLEALTVDEVPVEALAAYVLREPSDDLWQSAWRPGGRAARRWLLALPGGRTAGVRLVGDAVSVDGESFEATAVLDGDDVLLTTGGRTTRWATAVDGDQVWVGRDGAAWPLQEAVLHLREESHAHDGDITSPMPGSVIAVHAEAGAPVTMGQPLVVVEAMKMEHTLSAPLDGTLAELHVRVGQQVKVDELLAVVTP
jgi:acetyl-CoA/propionyl-CoA carboxylase biotin carboxyl carrier protein